MSTVTPTSSESQKIVMVAQELTRHYSVSRGFGKGHATVKALNGVSFELRRGQTLAVVGSSAISSFGLQAMAMAIITRWHMPPES